MYFKATYKYLAIFIIYLLQPSWLSGQYAIKADSWQETRKNRQGTITALWYDIEPFIYRHRGALIGVEKELMEGFKPFLKAKYGVDLLINWVDAGSFENIYPYISRSKEKGLFGLSFYSITEERKKEVKFSPAYMADLNIIVTSNNLPVYKNDNDFIFELNRLKSYTMKETTMEKDLLELKSNYFPQLPVSNQADDYEVLKQIAAYKNAFGYVPVSIYVVALQRGIKVKRQTVLSRRREGFAAIYTKESDWEEPVNAYFNSTACKALVNKLVKKYLGEEVADIILNVSSTDSILGRPTDIELLTKEREIVTQRLIDTALEVEREKDYRNIALSSGALMVILVGIVYNRARVKKKLNSQLQQRNALIDAQKKLIEEMNEQLKMKILQAKLNPHFLFNSLNSIQFFIAGNDRKGALLYLARFAAFLRNVLKHGDAISITADQEARLLEQYLWLEQCRFPGRFEYKVTITGTGTTHNADVPPMLVHSLVEDALYLGVLNLDETDKGLLDIVFEVVNNELIVKINDNGPTRDQALAKQQRKKLENIDGASEILEKRLELFNRRAGKKIKVTRQHTTAVNTVFVNEATLAVPQPLFN